MADAARVRESAGLRKFGAQGPTTAPFSCDICMSDVGAAEGYALGCGCVIIACVRVCMRGTIGEATETSQLLPCLSRFHRVFLISTIPLRPSPAATRSAARAGRAISTQRLRRAAWRAWARGAHRVSWAWGVLAGLVTRCIVFPDPNHLQIPFLSPPAHFDSPRRSLRRGRADVRGGGAVR